MACGKLGVSDAIGDIGTPPEGDDIGQRLLQALRSGQPALDAPSSERSGRKKLGRSLGQIQATAKALWTKLPRVRPPL
jgi:hypothetical protein